MHSCHVSFRGALLGTALALTVLTPALGANLSREDSKRIRAIEGNHHSALQLGSRSSRGVAGATYAVLHNFAGPPDDGANPSANVTLDDVGNIYGTTDFGGTNSDGAIFKLAPGGTETLLYSFVGGAKGSAPDGAVTLLPNGDLYGTAGSGGSSGNGVLFSLTAKGKYKVLHDFATNDGSFLRGDLVRDKKGNVYGTALFGGAGSSGTVFEYTNKGKFKVLHAFNNTDDGEYPEHGVVRDKAGNLYGATAFGPGIDGQGTVYKIASDGTFTALHNFTGGNDGGFLYGGLDIDKDGNVYGSTVDGGANSAGTVFKIAPDGTLTTLYNFTGGPDGASPEGDMTVVGKNLYSVASEGGDPTCQCGVVYEITAKGKEKVLHTFIGSDGGGYSAGVVASKGTFYGTIGEGNGNGLVFSVTKK